MSWDCDDPDNMNAISQICEEQEIIKDALIFYNFIWPEELYSGVMFFKGLRITKEEFVAAMRKK